MAFGKRFPRYKEGSTYPIWEEITLTKAQEDNREAKAREENIKVMKQCLIDSKKIMNDIDMREYDNNQVSIAIALFEKLASHSVYFKENLCKEIFDKEFSSSKKKK
jgi:hypothetical protein